MRFKLTNLQYFNVFLQHFNDKCCKIVNCYRKLICWMYYRKQEEYYNVLKNNPENIDNVDMSSMTYLRFFGPGCMALFIAIIIAFS